MSSSSAIARSRGIIKSRKTQAYIDTLAYRINQRGNGLQDSDIYEAKEYLKAYDYRTIKVTTSSPFTRSCVYVQMTNLRLWQTWLEPRVVAIPHAGILDDGGPVEPSDELDQTFEGEEQNLSFNVGAELNLADGNDEISASHDKEPAIVSSITARAASAEPGIPHEFLELARTLHGLRPHAVDMMVCVSRQLNLYVN
jgi:hypothetical protein